MESTLGVTGAITASSTEQDYKDYFFREYGNDAFAEGEMDILTAYFLDKSAEDAEEEKEALKAHKKDAIAEVKKLIVEYKLTKGDIKGKAIKQLMGE